MTLAEIEATMNEACEWGAAHGYKITCGYTAIEVRNGRWWIHPDACCPCGLVLLTKQPEIDFDFQKAVAEVFDVHPSWVSEFMRGQNGVSHWNRDYLDAFVLGRKFRERYVK